MLSAVARSKQQYYLQGVYTYEHVCLLWLVENVYKNIQAMVYADVVVVAAARLFRLCALLTLMLLLLLKAFLWHPARKILYIYYIHKYTLTLIRPIRIHETTKIM